MFAPRIVLDRFDMSALAPVYDQFWMRAEFRYGAHALHFDLATRAGLFGEAILFHGGRCASIPVREGDLRHLAVAVRYFDPPTVPAGDVVLFQIMDDLMGLLARRRVVGQLGPFRVIVPVAVVNREVVERHGGNIFVHSDFVAWISDTATRMLPSERGISD